MAAYAALVSVMHIIDHIQHHPCPPISLEKEHVESLSENITFLQDFLEGYSHVGGKEVEGLESRIADAAYAAEDTIESCIVDRILSRSIGTGKIVSFIAQVRKVIEDMNFIRKEVIQFKEKMGVLDQQLHRSSAVSAGLLRPPSTGQNTTMVGFDDVLYEVMNNLTGGQPDRHVIPFVGMGGIGKTTLARNIYQNQVVLQHFDILAWVNISQEYKMREILLELLQVSDENLSQRIEYEKNSSQTNEYEKNFSQLNEYELGVELHKILSGRRYLIIMDDIWDIEVWDQLKFLFPDNKNGSRIILTTRLSNLASQVADSHGIELGFLNEDDSWNLFSEIVFGEEGCPLELEKIGKKIVENCRGLPLSIVVVGGLLIKTKHIPEYWEYVEKNLNSIVNSEDNERCLKILQMSYNQLPAYLKPCFLYMGVFSEDIMIHVSELIKLWVAEGFLKPVSGKYLEEIAEEYLKELIDRNLIFVHELGCTGNIRYCNIHDLLRDLCLREAQKERFYNVIGQHSLNLPQDINCLRRIINPNSVSYEKVLDALQSTPLARSFICGIAGVPLPMSADFRLLRILKTCGKDSSYECFPEDILQFVNLRYLAIRVSPHSPFRFSAHLPWNLQTLIIHNGQGITAPTEIWNMPQLRHFEVKEGVHLPDPPSGGQDDIFLGNLETLLTIINFKCGEEVVKRIPKIKKLKVSYYEILKEGSRNYHLNNFGHLHKLEVLSCKSDPKLGPSETDVLQNLTFPRSLKKLNLKAFYVHWEDMLEKIGSLPLLEKLALSHGSFRTHKWVTVEGQFPSLKFLRINYCDYLEYWTTESSHFPRLQHLVLRKLNELKEIPSGIGEIPTLQSIELICCSDSVVISAKKILEEQEELHGEVGLQVRVKLGEENEALESSVLATPNFLVDD